MVIHPYSLHHLVSTDAVFDENTASWVAGSEDWEMVAKCRDEMNGGGGKITTADGEIYVFGSVVYFPKGKYNIKPGDSIKVTDKDGIIRVSGEVKSISSTRLNTRIWL